MKPSWKLKAKNEKQKYRRAPANAKLIAGRRGCGVFLGLRGGNFRLAVAPLFAIKTGKGVHRLIAAVETAKRASMMRSGGFAAFFALGKSGILQK